MITLNTWLDLGLKENAHNAPVDRYRLKCKRDLTFIILGVCDRKPTYDPNSDVSIPYMRPFEFTVGVFNNRTSALAALTTITMARDV